MNDLVIVENKKVGRPSDYNELFHIKLLYETFMNDEGIAAFCADANISVKTFHNWKRKYKNFRKAYHICLPKGARQSERKAQLGGKDFNFQSWKFIHMNRYREIYQTVPKAKSNSIEDMCIAAWKGFQKG